MIKPQSSFELSFVQALRETMQHPFNHIDSIDTRVDGSEQVASEPILRI